MVAGCSSEPEIKIVEGTAIDHGAALFRDPMASGTKFNAYACSTCHEAEAGDGGDAILPGAPLAGATIRPSYWGGQQLDLLTAINDCLYYFMLSSAPWTTEDVKARAMYAWLESLPVESNADEPVPFTPVYELVDAPAGDAARGADLYRRACGSCHGAAKTGANRITERAPILPDQTLAEHPPDQYTPQQRRIVFVQKVRHGTFVGYGGTMPPFSREKLSDQDLGDILTFFALPTQ
ncbi:MAG: c-type cytochrome [Polyangiaceae bacterium]|nr:c-type cytochrome [Polyangiaceae bacterium]